MGTEWKITNDRPIYLQLTEQIVQRIVSGQYPPASKLPSVRELAVEAGVNPNTMQRAFAELEREGLVTTNRTAGRIVTEDVAMIENIRGQLAAQKIEEFLEGMELLGFTGSQAAKLLTQYAKLHPALEGQTEEQLLPASGEASLAKGEGAL